MNDPHYLKPTSKLLPNNNTADDTADIPIQKLEAGSLGSVKVVKSDKPGQSKGSKSGKRKDDFLADDTSSKPSVEYTVNAEAEMPDGPYPSHHVSCVVLYYWHYRTFPVNPNRDSFLQDLYLMMIRARRR